MGKQMAFQLNAVQLRAKVDFLVNSYEEGKYATAGDWLRAVAKDEKDRQLLTVVFGIMNECTKENRKITRVRKVICWRGPDGKPAQVETQLERE